ncbi:PQQ-binding-like beta-propeller repeat protein [Dactylosporangium sp. CA-139066]|uniref:outer membrane protein assembly factor BamB family protein n=1 Tax=Dactylosporangium sp. CA-139066 TaxID=3239930 RepID=UPI003D9384A1
MRPFAAAGLLVVPAAVLTASVAAEPVPVVAPPSESAAGDGGLRPGDLVRGAAFDASGRDVVGYDPTADVLVAQTRSGAELAGLDAHTGTVRWRRALDTGGAYGTVLWSQTDLGGGSVLVNTFRRDTKAGELTALSTRNGEVRWRMPLTTRTEAMAAGPAIVVGEPARDSSSAQWADTRDAPGGSDVSDLSADARPPARKARATPSPAPTMGPHLEPSPSPTARPRGKPGAKATAEATAGPPATASARPRGRANKNAVQPTGGPSAGDAATTGAGDPGRSRIGRVDEDAGRVAVRDAPPPGTLTAVAAGDGGRLWTADLPEGCDLRAAAGDGRTVALRVACDGDDHLEIRDAHSGALRSRTDLDAAADDGGLGLLVRDGATLVRGPRTFELFAPDGRHLVDRVGDGCAEYCDLAVEGDVAIVAQSGGSIDRTDGALEAFDLADGAERWRVERTVRALVREGGRLYAVGPAPDPVPFLAVAGVGERGVSPQYATTVPAAATPQPGPALLVRSGDGLAWYRIRPVGRPAGYLGGAPTRPDPCAVLPAADVAGRLGRQPVTAHRDGAAACTLTSAKGGVEVKILWAGVDEASAIQRYRMIEGDGVQRFGTVVVKIEKL